MMLAEKVSGSKLLQRKKFVTVKEAAKYLYGS